MSDRPLLPTVDRLAAAGVRFTNAYTVSPVCSPSRTSVLTGVHVPIHGVYENGIVRYDHRDSITPYFDVLKAAGYDTALIGKTHFSPSPTSIDHLDAHTGNNDKRSETTAAEDFLETYLVDETMTWLDARSPGTPWYVYTSMVSPHPPNWVPKGEPWSSAYDGVELPPLNYRGDDIAELPYQTRMLLGLLGKEDNHPPAFPQAQPDMTFIDQPLQQARLHPSHPPQSFSSRLAFCAGRFRRGQSFRPLPVLHAGGVCRLRSRAAAGLPGRASTQRVDPGHFCIGPWHRIV